MPFPHQIIVNQATTYVNFLRKHKHFYDTISFIGLNKLTIEHELILSELGENAENYGSLRKLVLEAVSKDTVAEIINITAHPSLYFKSIILAGLNTSPGAAEVAINTASEQRLFSEIVLYELRADTISAVLNIRGFPMHHLTLRQLNVESTQTAMRVLPKKISKLIFYDLHRTSVFEALKFLVDDCRKKRLKEQLRCLGIGGNMVVNNIIDVAFELSSSIDSSLEGCILHEMPDEVRRSTERYFNKMKRIYPESKLRLIRGSHSFSQAWYHQFTPGSESRGGEEERKVEKLSMDVTSRRVSWENC